MYSSFMDLVEEGRVEEVILQDGTLEITLKEGATYTDDEGNTYDNSVTLFTEDMGDPNLIPWLRDNGWRRLPRPMCPRCPPSWS